MQFSVVITLQLTQLFEGHCECQRVRAAVSAKAKQMFVSGVSGFPFELVFQTLKLGEIARSKSRIACDLKTRDSNRWRLCDLKLRFETRDWRFVLNTPIQQNCEKGCDLSPRSKIASDWRLAILPI